MKALQALNTALEREIEGQQYYNQAAVKAGDEKGRRFFEWLSHEETGHIKLLNEAIAALREHQSWLKKEIWEGKHVSEPVSRDEFPSKPEVMGELPANAPELEVIEKAIEAERSDAGFYEVLAKEVEDPDGKSMLQKLALIERGHAEVLEEEYQWIKHARVLFTLHRFLPAG